MRTIDRARTSWDGAAATRKSTERFDGGTNMEEVAVVSLAQPETDCNSSLTREQAALRLEEAAQRIRTLLLDESNAWELGQLLNTIVRSGLPRKAGWGRTRRWLMANVPEAHGRDTTLYRYAHIAAEYTKEQVELWGVRKLDALSHHDHARLREPDPRELSKREIELIQADGSTPTKKFGDCHCRELQLSNRLRRKAAKDAGQEIEVSAATSLPKIEVPAAISHPEIEVRSSRKPLAVLALGILMICTFAFLPASRFATAVLVYGIGFLLTGIAILAWRGARSVERLNGAAPKERP